MSELLKHIESINAQRKAMQDAEPGSWYSMWDTSPQYIAELWFEGVRTPDDWDRMQLANSISDCSKAAVGCRINSDWREHTKQELQDILDGWVRLANEQYELEREFEEQDSAEAKELEKFEAMELNNATPLPYEEYAYLEALA